MATNYQVWNFPELPVKSQLFHVPGAAFDGGFTSGGARISSPEPGGRAVLEMQLALQVNEWNTPFASWIMSKINGDIFRIKLAKTPQLLTSDALGIINTEGVPWDAETIYSESNWDNDMMWGSESTFSLTEPALEGSTFMRVDMVGYIGILKPGHAIGHGNSTYLVENISYNANIATIWVMPPIRKTISTGEIILTDPVFVGSIANGSEIRNAYDASNNGHIQLNRIVFQEVII